MAVKPKTRMERILDVAELAGRRANSRAWLDGFATALEAVANELPCPSNDQKMVAAARMMISVDRGLVREKRVC